MYYVEMVEEKDRPRKLSKQEFHEEGGTAALLLCMKNNLFGTGKMRCYWPKHVNGPGIQSFVKDKAIGHHARLPGVLDEDRFDIFGLKEPEYTMMVMSTYGQLAVAEGQKDNMRNVGT
eukprot:4311796-Ditylum_brightwellii.AAC.1